MSDSLAMILHCLYSDEHKKERKNKEKEMEGLQRFLKENLTCKWKGFAVWDAGNGFEYISCDGDGSDVGYEPKPRGYW